MRPRGADGGERAVRKSGGNPMTDKKSWQEFFDAHTAVYMQNSFTSNTLREVDFVIEELGIAPGSRVLDMGCGTGRHSVELARRGYAVTGVDQSARMLAEARAAANQAGVEAEWVQADATRFTCEPQFDGAICLCEGAFGLLETAEDVLSNPSAILRNVSHALKPGAKTVFTVLNGCLMIRKHTQTDVERNLFDPLTLSEVSECSPAEGMPAMRVRERAFVPTELVLLFEHAGMTPLHIWGGTAGKWDRGPIQLDEIELMVVAKKI